MALMASMRLVVITVLRGPKCWDSPDGTKVSIHGYLVHSNTIEVMTSTNQAPCYAISSSFIHISTHPS